MSIRANPPFRLLYDLRWMELGRAGGVEQAAYELIDTVARIDRKNHYRILAPRSACWEWRFPPQFSVTRHESERTTSVTGIGFDLLHATCSYIDPALLEFPAVVTVHDLQHLHHPEFFSPETWREREKLYRESAERARHVICISEFTRRDLHARYGVPLERITTIWNIPSATMWEEVPARRARALLEDMRVGASFLFFPAQCWPHKNHARLLQAFARARSRLPQGMKLVMTGQPFPADHPARALMREEPLAGAVLHLGYRSPLEIRTLFQACTALVFPSLFEGFGMPVAEAIIAGKPVACSNATSLPEIAGDAALTFDPLDVPQMAECMVDLATRAELRERLSEAARRRRSAFSAHASALKTLAVYEEVVDRMAGAS